MDMFFEIYFFIGAIFYLSVLFWLEHSKYSTTEEKRIFFGWGTVVFFIFLIVAGMLMFAPLYIKFFSWEEQESVRGLAFVAMDVVFILTLVKEMKLFPFRRRVGILTILFLIHILVLSPAPFPITDLRCFSNKVQSLYMISMSMLLFKDISKKSFVWSSVADYKKKDDEVLYF